uniref:OSJNBb0108J11.12 protein n=1 Tax=Oryza sativa subsp. japonica TaxID=39947 RepID=Q7XQX9_ORYSJ|nr:OSJNBb0108J11.12 [Oryza sativa Japonica Group]
MAASSGIGDSGFARRGWQTSSTAGSPRQTEASFTDDAFPSGSVDGRGKEGAVAAYADDLFTSSRGGRRKQLGPWPRRSTEFPEEGIWSEVGEFGFEQGGRQYNHRVPKLDFPKFDGTDPQDWRMRCEHYFDVNNTYPGLWVRVATIYFYGRAASWLRSSRAHVRFPVWDDFCIAVSTKFDRDQHDVLIRQMDTIRQSRTVWEYYEKFDELMNQLLSYDPVISKKYLVHRFTEGLRREIRNAVLLQRLHDLESALAIVSLQEEVLEAPPESGVKDSKGGMHIRSNSVLKGALPLPLPPGKGVLSAVGKVDDKKGIDGGRPVGGSNKMVALKAQRRAQGLCYICAEKWSPTHRCANSCPAIRSSGIILCFRCNWREFLF